MNPLDEYLNEVDERVKAATNGPWHSTHTGRVIQTKHVTRDVWNIPKTFDDSEFIAHSRTDIETLLKIVRAQDNALMNFRGVPSDELTDTWDKTPKAASCAAALSTTLANEVEKEIQSILEERSN